MNKREEFMARIGDELDRAYKKHGRAQWGRHEFYGIIKEEFDELWADIKSDAPQEQLEAELVQVAAMCFRYFETRDRYREPATRVIDVSDFDADVQKLIVGEYKKGHRILIDSKRSSDVWRAEIWAFSGTSWYQRSKALHASLFDALQQAIKASDDRQYASDSE